MVDIKVEFDAKTLKRLVKAMDRYPKVAGKVLKSRWGIWGRKVAKKVRKSQFTSRGPHSVAKGPGGEFGHLKAAAALNAKLKFRKGRASGYMRIGYETNRKKFTAGFKGIFHELGTRARRTTPLVRRRREGRTTGGVRERAPLATGYNKHGGGLDRVTDKAVDEILKKAGL